MRPRRVLANTWATRRTRCYESLMTFGVITAKRNRVRAMDGASRSETFPLIVLVSGERLLMRAVLLYEAEKVAEIAALKAQAAEKLQGFSTGIGFWGSPGWVLGGAAALGLVEGFLSGSKQRQGLQLLRLAAAKFEELAKTAVFVPADQVWNLQSPHPQSWSAALKLQGGTWVAKTFGKSEQQYVHNGEDFVNIKTDAGVVCIRWSHVASYVPPHYPTQPLPPGSA
jgi:hypothetical protein